MKRALSLVLALVMALSLCTVNVMAAVQPTEPSQPTVPTAPTQPSQPIIPSEPTTPVDPSEPTTPVDPSEPTTPVDPSEPTTPVDPSEPTTPVDPSEPTTPVDPSEPTTPVDPSEPVNPEDPTEPVDPEDPTEPSDDPTQAFRYIDVSSKDWFYDAVMYVTEKGIMNGTSLITFSPETITTRAMIVTMLYRLEGEPAVTGTNPFDDVAADKYYTDAVIWAVTAGVAKGITEDLFKPDQTVTREQLATFLYRYAQFKGYDVSVGEDTNILSFGDAASVSEYAVPAMQWAVGEGIINGIAGDLKPQNGATRAQVATMFMRFMENVVK